MLTRRTALAPGRPPPSRPTAAASPSGGKRPAPKGFLWGTAISAYQSEGNNTNTDAWLLENLTPTLYKDRSGDSIDSYHRYAEDIALNARLGFNTYRFGIEWARIEPSEGIFLQRRARPLRTGAEDLRAARPKGDRHLQPLLLAAVVLHARRMGARRRA